MEKRVSFRQSILPYLLVAPQIVITLIFFMWPASQALYQSVLREDAFGAAATRRGAWCALLLLTLLCSYQYGAVFQQRTVVGGFRDPFPTTTTAADLERRRLRAEVLAALPPDASVAASESVAPHVSNRAVAYTLREGVLDAEYVVFGLVPEAQGELRVVRALLQGGDFGVAASSLPQVIFSLGTAPE